MSSNLISFEDQRVQASSSNGRAPDSKSGSWGFESLLACHSYRITSYNVCYTKLLRGGRTVGAGVISEIIA